ncbi:MAG: GTP 3',8-cyclase MoaA [Eubacteriales bacterium]|nr:GTP 3',8-cyclase MoaA [Eubacteriales bacterium]
MNRTMLDTFGREVRMLRLAVTEACDLRCEYCMPQNGLPNEAMPMSGNELVAIAEAASKCGINKIRLTGGEPLLRPDIVDICRRLSHIEGIRTLCLTTNGTRLQALAGQLYAAGVKRVNLSLDSLNPERYARLTRCGNLADVLAGLEAAMAAGFERVKVNCVLIGGINDDEIADFVELTRHKPLEVRFIELMPMGECAAWPKKRFISAETVLERCPELTPIPGEGVAQRCRLPNAVGTVGLIRPMSRAFCGDCDRIRVTADGKLKPCLHSVEELDLRGLRGQALVRRMAEGIGDKPVSHHLNDTGTDTERRMSQIGG